MLNLGKQWMLAIAGCAFVFAFIVWYGLRDPAASAPAALAAPAAASAEMDSPAQAAAPPAESAPPVAAGVARWIADTNSADAQRRAAAIKALAGAPRADALPVLRGVLMNGEPEVDRKLALASLRELALAQGDADGAARDAVRQAIYHGDDFMPKDDLQETLDIIEESELK